MTPDDLLRRRPLWDAMSDLFLDTETRWNVPYVARRAAESGYDDETLERIFWVEVFPEGIGNLLELAGEWAVLALDEPALIKRANAGKVPWLARRAHGWMVEKEWLGARQVTKWLRDLPGGEREQRSTALSLLVHRYFYEPDRECLVATRERLAPVRALAAEEWLRFEAVCLAMTLDEERAQHAARVAAVQSLL